METQWWPTAGGEGGRPVPPPSPGAGLPSQAAPPTLPPGTSAVRSGDLANEGRGMQVPSASTLARRSAPPMCSNTLPI